MDLYCVMGNPVAHSKSPWIHARFAQLTGEPVAYERRLIPLDGFAAGVRAFRAEGGRGCNVTVPFKFQAPALADHVSARGRQAGACNTLRFDADGIHADNTDGVGLVADLRDNARVLLQGARLLLVGAGGAAAGVLGPLLQARPAALTIANRSPDKARALVASHGALARDFGVALSACGLDEAPSACDVVINGTAASLGGAGIPVPARVLRPGALALDMMYGPAAQPFLDWAAAHGAIGRDGLGMLVEQAAEAFAFWRGVRPPSAQVLDELRAELARP